MWRGKWYKDVPCLLPRWIWGDRLTNPKGSRRIPKPDQGSVVVPGYALEFYNALKAKAEIETVDGEDYTIFRGGITAEYDALKFSRAHYSRVVKALEHIGAIQVIQRGNPRQESAVVLHGEPTVAALSEAYYLTRPSEQRRVKEGSLESRVDSLERRLGTDISYVDAMINVEGRLQALERKAGLR